MAAQMVSPSAANLAAAGGPEDRQPVVIERTETIPELITDMSRLYKTDGSLALRIAKCESNLAQYKKDGSIVRGRVINADVGIFQVNETYHLEQSRRLGFDIYTAEGNIGYATWLLKHEGSRHWNSSKRCWSQSDNQEA